MLLGVDMGTSSTKAVLTTAAGEIVATATRAHSMSLPRPGWAEVDAAAVWWDDLCAVVRQLTDALGDHTLVGVGVSGVGPCLLVCDDALDPVGPAILYGIDGRAHEQIVELTERLGADAIRQRCGKDLSSQAIGPKMLWLQQHAPQAFARGRRWYNSNSYAVAKLTGAYVLDHHTASQCDPLYDVQARAWAQDWVPGVAGHLAMPELCWPHEQVGSVTAEAAAATGIAEGTPVVAGTVDAWAEAFSAGVREPGDVMLMYGSTTFLIQVLDGFRVHEGLWTTAGVAPGQFTFAAGTSTSGSLTAWLRDLTGGTPLEDLVREACAVGVGADGLVVLPYFAGERSPHYDPRARGVVAGLTLRHTRGHLFRAAYEGIAFAIRQIVEVIVAAGHPVHRVVGVGGGTQGALLTQVVSDVTGLVQQIPEETIGASYGSALLAGIGTGLVSPDTDWARIRTTITPNPAHRAAYDELYATYSSLYPATREQVHALAAFEEAAFRTAAEQNPPTLVAAERDPAASGAGGKG